MHRSLLLLLGALLLASVQPSHGMATEQVGPESTQNHPTSKQLGWPAGMLSVVQHESRVYTRWINGNESFYYQANTEELNELVHRFCLMRLRDHEITIKTGPEKVGTFSGDSLDCNINFTFIGGIARGVHHEKKEAITHDPTLTIFLNPDSIKDSLKQLVVPAHAILRYDLEGSNLKSPHRKPARKVWHAKMLFEDGKPATDFNAGVNTKVNLWDRDHPDPISLGIANHKGLFHAAFSDLEMADLHSSKAWITLTTGNYLTKPNPQHPKLPVLNLSLDVDTVPITTVARPGYYYGRILFDDGSPPILDPAPWPGAEIMVSFPFAGPANPDPEGYFSVYFTDEQLAELTTTRKDRRNIYVPSYEKKGRSSAKYVFPVGVLSRSKDEAGVVKIANPAPAPEEDG